MDNILTVTLNPALDLATETPKVRPGPKLRCALPQADPGGGGINVSRAIARLGGTSLALVATGGATGARLLDLLAGEGIDTRALEIAGETRQSLAVTEAESGLQYRFVMPGPEWPPIDVDRALFAIGEAVAPGGYAVLSGSNPPGVPVDFPGRMARLCAEHGTHLFVDTSGAPLAELAANPTRPHVLRMDAEEAETLAGRPLDTRADTAHFAETLRAGGVADIVIVARGADGSTMAAESGLWHAARPVERVVSAVGAGDSFVAGFTLAIERGAEPPEALRHGAAAAAATCLTPATQLCTHADVKQAFEGCTLERL